MQRIRQIDRTWESSGSCFYRPAACESTTHPNLQLEAPWNGCNNPCKVTKTWNHNTHYHSVIVGYVPRGCGLALDAGCGQGALAQKLARRCVKVIAIDTDKQILSRAKRAAAGEPNVVFLNGDILLHPFQPETFDFIVAVATVHHLPLQDALAKFRLLLKPRGVLVIVGLYRLATPLDFALAAAATPISRALRIMRGEAKVGAPLQDPRETLREIRLACHAILPGGTFRRRFFFRYSFVWRRPF